jgi:hypothetical protein
MASIAIRSWLRYAVYENLKHSERVCDSQSLRRSTSAAVNCRGHAQYREAIVDVMRNVAAMRGLACAQHARSGVKWLTDFLYQRDREIIAFARADLVL